jgi:HdeA/HdeB family
MAGEVHMGRYFALTAAAIAFQTLCLVAAANGQALEEIPCDAFVRNADGTWSATKAAFILGPNFSVRAGALFRPGEPVRGYDLAGKLEEACRNYVPPTAPTDAGQPQQPSTSLSKYADANGNLDVSRLACGHLADAPQAEAEMLLTWYAGSSNTAAKKRNLNMAHLRTAVRSVIDYCKANREKSLVKTMDLMLK